MIRVGSLARAAAAAAVAWTAGVQGAQAARWDETYFPDVALLTHAGETVRFYDDLVRGKIVVFDFVYTDCPDICGLSTARMAQVQEWLGDRVGRDIFIYSVTLDPENDTPEKLARYAAAFGVGPGWTFLTGAPEDVRLVRFKLGERSRKLSEHRTDIVIGNDATGEWRRASLMGSLVLATEEILALDPARDAEPRPPTAVAAAEPEGGYAIADTRGEGLFLKACAACHTLGEGVRVGPDLAGVTLRRDHAWLRRYLMRPDAMTASGDPVAAALDAAFPGVRMPNLGLGEADADDLIAYLEAQTGLLDSAAPSPAGHHHHPGASASARHTH